MSNQVMTPTTYVILQQLKQEIFKGLRVCLPGIITAVDMAAGTVSVKIGIMQKVAKQGLPNGLAASYPQLTECPLVTIQGGGIGVVMPVSVDDECLVVFSDRCIDAWVTNGQPMPLPSVRMHDINDGFVIVGLNSLPNALLTPLDDGEGGLCETQNPAGAKIVINPTQSKVNISNSVTSLYKTLSDLITSLNLLITTIESVNTGIIADAAVIPNAAAAATAANVILMTTITAQLTAVQAQIDALQYP